VRVEIQAEAKGKVSRWVAGGARLPTATEPALVEGPIPPADTEAVMLPPTGVVGKGAKGAAGVTVTSKFPV